MNLYQSQEHQDEIDLYLSGLLNDNEVETFEERLKTDPKFAYEVEKLRIARSLVKNGSSKDKHSFSADDFFFNKNNKVNAYSISIKFLVGLCLLFLLVFIYQFVTISSNILFEEQFTPYSSDIVSDTPSSKSSSILHSYRSRNFQDVIHMYENKELQSNEEVFISGVSYLELDKPEKAINCFNKILNKAEKGGDNDYLYDAEYFSGIANLKIKQVDASYWFFSKIYHDEVHAYHEKVNKWFYWKLKILKFRRKLF